MKHLTSQKLYSYWRDIKGERLAPDRRDLEPEAIKTILRDTFILEVCHDARYVFRLAGTRLCSLYCRELKTMPFNKLWKGRDSELLATLLEAVHNDGAAAIIGIEAHTKRGQELDLEMLLLPMTFEGQNFQRILGSISPAYTPYWLGVYPLERLKINSLRLIWPDEEPSFSKPVKTIIEPHSLPNHQSIPIARRGHLTVYEGGRA